MFRRGHTVRAQDRLTPLLAGKRALLLKRSGCGATTTLAKVGGISEERRIEKLPASLILFNKLLYAGKCEAT